MTSYIVAAWFDAAGRLLALRSDNTIEVIA